MNRYDLMDALNRVDEAQLEATGRFFECGKEQTMTRKPIRTVRLVLIAAAVMLMLGATAYASGLLGLKGRVVEPEETFPVSFRSMEGDEEPIEGNWTGTYALEFESPETCPPVRYRFGWLPEGMAVPDYALAGDGWVKRWDYEGKPGFVPWGAHAEVGDPEDRDHFFVSDMYYAPQFVNGGALILLDTVVDSVEQETWGELSVLKLSSSKWENFQHEQTAFDLPRHFVVLFHPEQGWIFVVRGTFPMEELVKIAENLEVEQTEGLVEHGQFENPYDFFDAARG
ncbi:MAG: hypothetical protein Q4E38_01850 [Eubacteriales bacterium]|nr:hypothetical protein [Eubacteriales bacterium]